MIEVGSLAIIVVTVTASCCLGSFLAKFLWSDYVRRNPSFLYCARCHRMIGARDFNTVPHQIQNIIDATTTKSVEIKSTGGCLVDPTVGPVGSSGSATMQRLGMRDENSPRGFDDTRLQMNAKHLESKALSPLQDSPDPGGLFGKTGVVRLSPSPQPSFANLSKVANHPGSPAVSLGTLANSTVPIYGTGGGTTTEMGSKSGNNFANSIGGQSDLVYNDDKNHQVRLLQSPDSSPQTRTSNRFPVSKTPGNASGKRPIRPSGSIKSRRSLVTMAFGSMSNGRREAKSRSCSGGVDGCCSDLDGSDAEARTPLLEEEQERSCADQLQSGRRNRGSPSNTTDMAAQLRNVKMSATEDIDINSPRPPPNQNTPLSGTGMLSNGRGKPDRSTRQVGRSTGQSAERSTRQVDRSTGQAADRSIGQSADRSTGQSTGRHGHWPSGNHTSTRTPAAVKKVYRTASSRHVSKHHQFYTESEVTSQSEDERGQPRLRIGLVQYSPRQKKNLTNQSSNHELKNQVANPSNNSVQTRSHVTSRRSLMSKSPSHENLPIVDHQQLVTSRRDSIEDNANDRSLLRQSYSNSRDFSCHIEIETPALSPLKAEGAASLQSSNYPRGQSNSPLINLSANVHQNSHSKESDLYTRRRENRQNYSQECGQMSRLTVDTSSLVQQMVNPGTISSPQIMLSPDHLAKTVDRSASWRGEVNISHPSIHKSIVDDCQEKVQRSISPINASAVSLNVAPPPPPPSRSSGFSPESTTSRPGSSCSNPPLPPSRPASSCSNPPLPPAGAGSSCSNPPLPPSRPGSSCSNTLLPNSRPGSSCTSTRPGSSCSSARPGSSCLSSRPGSSCSNTLRPHSRPGSSCSNTPVPHSKPGSSCSAAGESECASNPCATGSNCGTVGATSGGEQQAGHNVFFSPQFDQQLIDLREVPRHTVPKTQYEILQQEAVKGRERQGSQSTQDWIMDKIANGESSQTSGAEFTEPYPDLPARATDSSIQSVSSRARRATESSQAQSMEWDHYQSDPHFVKSQLDPTTAAGKSEYGHGVYSSEDRDEEYGLQENEICTGSRIISDIEIGVSSGYYQLRQDEATTDSTDH